jgi:hypothetical protein
MRARLIIGDREAAALVQRVGERLVKQSIAAKMYDPRAMVRVMEVLAPENRSARIQEAIAKQFPGQRRVSQFALQVFDRIGLVV